MEFAFHFHNSLAKTGTLLALDKLLGTFQEPPVVVCVGSDLVVGDSLGPITGTLLSKKLRFAPIFGTLRRPITAKEVKYLTNFIKETYPRRTVIAVDAAVGETEDVGLIKISNSPLKPGAGANKKLGKIGDISILGIVAQKKGFSTNKLSYTRLNMIYEMSDIISDGLRSYFEKTA